jgi:aminopeptidase N
LGCSAGSELHAMHLVLDPSRSAMACTDTVSVVSPERSWVFDLDARLRVLEVLADAGEWFEAGVQREKSADGCRYTVVADRREAGDTLRLLVRYEGAMPPVASAGDFSHQYNLAMEPAIISTEGAFLGEECSWYPRGCGGIQSLRLEVDVPTGWESVSLGDWTARIPFPDRVSSVWEAHHPVPGLTLVAGPYQVAHLRWQDVSVYTFFYESEVDLAQTYLGAAVGRLALYDRMLGSYPYTKFAVVENFLPTGYAMPSFTLLGGGVLRLPFIPHISLGHEVLHNWWGNGVFVSDNGGNWCEGLTTYLADYWYEEMEDESAARRYRRQILLDYANYVGEDDVMPLTDFIGRTTPSTRVIGYGKAAMLFHMLRSMLGEETFFTGLRAFYREYLWREASWSNLCQVFSEASGQNLDWFHSQWVERAGAPVLVLDEATRDSNLVRVRLAQRGEPYRLLVPLVVGSAEGDVHGQVWLSGAESTYTVTARSRPTEVVIDPGFDLFRLLAASEVPPALGRALADTLTVFVAIQKEAVNVAASLARLGQRVVCEENPPVGGIPTPSVMVGMPNREWIQRLSPLCPPGTAIDSLGFTVEEHTGTWDNQVLVAALASPEAATGALAVALGKVETLLGVERKLQHYGKYGYLVISEGSVAAKGQWEAGASPLRERLEPIERSTLGP